jgi:hypothetical protein
MGVELVQHCISPFDMTNGSCALQAKKQEEDGLSFDDPTEEP